MFVHSTLEVLLLVIVLYLDPCEAGTPYRDAWAVVGIHGMDMIELGNNDNSVYSYRTFWALLLAPS